MRLIYLDNQSQVLEHEQFLQSWQWASFQEETGSDVLKLGVQDNNELIALAFVIKKKIFGFTYLYCPRGPILKKENKEIDLDDEEAKEAQKNNNKKEKVILEFFFSEIKKIAEEFKAVFLRFEPAFDFDLKDFKRSKIKKTIDIQTKKTSILNLSQSNEELLAKMKQKTRYNIRLAKKKNIEIVESDEFDLFWGLMNQTKTRDGFRLHEKEYYKKMVEHDVSFMKLFLAEYEGKAIACALMCFFDNSVIYLHGGSSDEHRNLMAPYLLQWYCIDLAKDLGYKYYDFNGISEKKWPGVTKFKVGFGGEEIEYPGTFDLVFNTMYYSVYNIVRKIRRFF